MSDIEVFQFPATGADVRTVLIDGEPWFVARDVAAVLGYANGNRDVARHTSERQRREYRIGTPSGMQTAVLLNEPGVYRMVMRSNMPKAVEFQDWLAEEVLPSIRRIGRYESPAAAERQHRLPQTFAEALRLAADQAEAIEKQNAAIAELEPRAAQADHYREADGLYAIASFANDLQQWAREHHGVKVLHEEVRDFLGNIGFIIRGDTVRNNEPKAEAIKAGYVRQKHTTYETNTRGRQSTTTARLTPKGWGYAWDRAVRRIADHGDLTPIKTIQEATR